MRVLLLSADPSLPLGGSRGGSLHLRSLADALVRAGHQVGAAVAELGQLRDVEALRTRGVQVHLLPTPRDRNTLRAAFTALRPDAVVEALGPQASAGVAACGGLQIPHIFLAHAHREAATEPRPYPLDQAGPGLRAVLEESLGALAVSDEIAECLRSFAPATFEVERVPALAGPAREGAARAELLGWARRVVGACARDFTVGFLGSLGPPCDPLTLVEAAAIARPRVGVRLVMLGTGPQSNSLLARSLERGVPAVFAGATSPDETRALLECCDALALSTLANGSGPQSPETLVTAMTAGRAVVATDVAPHRRVLEDGSAGMLVPPADASALSHAIATLAQSPERRTLLGEEALRKAARQYRWDVAVRSVERWAGTRRASGSVS
jgi:glycosyltransferase involved in cell wall biosynthesis